MAAAPMPHLSPRTLSLSQFSKCTKTRPEVPMRGRRLMAAMVKISPFSSAENGNKRRRSRPLRDTSTGNP